METALSLIISNGDFPKKSLKHFLFLALKSKEMVECQEEGYQLQISNHRPGHSSAGNSPSLYTAEGSLKITATWKLAGEESKTGKNIYIYICVYIYINAGGLRRKIFSTSGKYWISLPQTCSCTEGCYFNTQSIWGVSQVLAFHAEPTSPSWQGRLHCCGSSFGVPDLGINELIRSAGEGERDEGRKRRRHEVCWRALPLLMEFLVVCQGTHWGIWVNGSQSLLKADGSCKPSGKTSSL